MVIRLELDLKPLLSRIEAAPEKINRAAAAAVEYQRSPAQSWMRANAPWTDRTSNARNGLFATAAHNGTKHELILAHSVPYGIWLEVRWSGRYSVIKPAVENQGAALMQALTTILGAI